jgi:iron complex outermembrane receptor protein
MTPKRHESRHIAARINPISAAVALAAGSITLTGGGAMAANPLLEEMIVTATRRAESVQDIPLNISAYSGSELEHQRINNLRDFARYVPGLTVVDQGPRASSPMIVRGLNVDVLAASESLGNSSGGTVATYFGEIPIYIDLDLVDVDRIEVLRGPQGTLFGAGSLGGAVRFMPNKPQTENFEVEAHGQVYNISNSDDSSYQGDIVFNTPFAGDRAAFRGVASYRDQAGWIDQPYLVNNPGFSNPEGTTSADIHAKKDVNDWKRTTLRGTFLWDISDSIESTLGYNYQKDEMGGRQFNHKRLCEDILSGTSGRTDNTTPPGIGAYPPPAFPANCNPDNFEAVNALRVEEPNERENQIFNLNFIADLSFGELTSATGYTLYEENGQRDQTDLLLNFEYSYGDFPTFTAFTAETEENTTLTQEFRVVSQGAGPLNWIGGLFYLDATLDQTSTEFTPGYDVWPGAGAADTNSVEYSQFVDEKLTEWAIFGEIGYQIFDRWQVTGGLRYFDVTDTFTQGFALPICSQQGFCDPQPPPPAGSPIPPYVTTLAGPDASFDDVIFKLNTSFDFTDTLLGYITWSEGYRNGGSNGLADCSTLTGGAGQNLCGTADELGFAPDTTTNWELGVKTAWLGGDLVFNGALFLVQWDGVQVAETSAGGAIPITINGNDAETKGVEMDLNYSIGEKWLIQGGYSYTNAELTQDAPQLAGGEASKGDRLPGTPEHQASLLVNFLQPLGRELDLNVSYGLTTQSNVYSKLGIGSACCRIDNGLNSGTGEVLPGFTLHNASVALAGDKWEVMLYANNLTDKYAVTGVRNDPSFNVSSIESQGFTFRRYGNYMATPRTIGLDFRFRTDF